MSKTYKLICKDTNVNIIFEFISDQNDINKFTYCYKYRYDKYIKNEEKKRDYCFCFPDLDLNRNTRKETHKIFKTIYENGGWNNWFFI